MTEDDNPVADYIDAISTIERQSSIAKRAFRRMDMDEESEEALIGLLEEKKYVSSDIKHACNGQQNMTETIYKVYIAYLEDLGSVFFRSHDAAEAAKEWLEDNGYNEAFIREVPLNDTFDPPSEFHPNYDKRGYLSDKFNK